MCANTSKLKDNQMQSNNYFYALHFLRCKENQKKLGGKKLKIFIAILEKKLLNSLGDIFGGS